MWLAIAHVEEFGAQACFGKRGIELFTPQTPDLRDGDDDAAALLAEEALQDSAGALEQAALQENVVGSWGNLDFDSLHECLMITEWGGCGWDHSLLRRDVANIPALLTSPRAGSVADATWPGQTLAWFIRMVHQHGSVE